MLHLGHSSSVVILYFFILTGVKKSLWINLKYIFLSFGFLQLFLNLVMFSSSKMYIFPHVWSNQHVFHIFSIWVDFFIMTFWDIYQSFRIPHLILIKLKNFYAQTFDFTSNITRFIGHKQEIKQAFKLSFFKFILCLEIKYVDCDHFR